MSTELLEIQGGEAALAVLEEFHATQDECGDFFGGVFDELHALSAELFARERCLETSAAARQKSASSDVLLASCRDDFRRAVAQLQQFSASLESQLGRLAAMATEIAVAQAELLRGASTARNTGPPREIELPPSNTYQQLFTTSRTPDIA